MPRHLPILAVLFAQLVLPVRAHARGHDVLVLNSYHPSYEWTDRLVRGVHAALDGVLPAEDLHVEYMDARRMVDDEEYLELLAALLARKYSHHQPDVIISSDDSALTFLIARRDALFPGVPVVFCGVNARSVEELAEQPAMTGILEGLAVRENLALIARLHPRASQVVLLSDRTSLGRDMTKVARAVLPEFARPGRTLTLWDDFTLDELGARLAALGPNSAVLLLAIHEDRAGRYFSYPEQLPGLTAQSRAPVYAMFGMLLGQGVTGGMMNDPYEHGRAAANMARRVLAGEPADTIPIVPSAVYAPRFDAPQLARFAIPDERLPPGSAIVGRPTSFYQQHRALVWSVLLVVCALTAAVLWLVGLVRRMRRAEQELRERESELRRAQRLELIGRLAGGIAHDFNNLLVPIQGCTELIEQVAPSDEATRKHFDALHLATDRAARLARQMLALSRPQSTEAAALDLDALVRDLERLLCRLVHERTRLVVEPCDTPVWVEADRARLEQALINLVVNANDAVASTPSGAGEVRIVVEERRAGTESWGVIRVTDTGIGMGEEVRARVFDPFFTTKASGRGTGLGLSSAQSAVAQYGGSLVLLPPAGRGTGFEIRLPLCSAPALEPSPKGSQTSRRAPARASVRVLVVDDDELARAVIAEGLRSLGHDARSATALEAEQLLAGAAPFDVLVCDVMMPALNGPELWRRVRAAHPALRVIFMTGYDAGLLGDAQEGVHDAPTLHKPFPIEHLDVLVREQQTRARVA